MIRFPGIVIRMHIMVKSMIRICSPMAKMTLRNGIERTLKKQVPGVREVVAVE